MNRFLWLLASWLLSPAAGLGLAGRSQAQEVLDSTPIAAAKPESTVLVEEPLTAGIRSHWAWLPLSRPAEPEVKNTAWARNPVDRFVLAKLEESDLAPLPADDRVTLLRRVTFDLTGLPAKPQDIDAFLADDSAEAYEKVVQRLLASPAYGERWAQHWLDLARYADSDGYEHDVPRPKAWRYRDWVIDALNRDVPYDEFVRLQLAGDELYPGDEQAAVATGFCLCGPDMPDINLKQERRHTVLNEMTSTVGAVFLGLQIGCAQCHDHKYDPISQADFYRLRAILEPGVPLKDTPVGRTLSETTSRAEKSHLWIRGDFRRQGPELGPAFPRIANLSGAGVPEPADEATSTGRRAALAAWLTRPDQPLALRVIANRLWQFHFGRGLSTTPSDFGLLGDEPSHRELLDWLATELPRQEWSLKRMHKLLVTSATYRQASHTSTVGWTDAERGAAAESWKKGKQTDPRNRLLWRMNRRRLEGEAVRDAMLAASDRLSERRGGPGIMTPLPAELLKTTVAQGWKPSEDEEDHRRRSIYLMVRRTLRHPLFEVFDRPDTNASCPQRGRSTTAPQSLVLLNSDFSLSAARDLANFVREQAGVDEKAQIVLCHRRTLGREPDEKSLATAHQFLAEQRKLHSAEISRQEKDEKVVIAALVQFCLALFNLNEFIYID